MIKCYICKKIIFTFVKTIKGGFEKNQECASLVFYIIDECLFYKTMELIKDRLSHIIRAKNLTATQFAEMMQIQPSNVSHLLSGRNKPSLDFLIKLKEIFPEYNYEWIILGKKPITTNEPSFFNKGDISETYDNVQNVDNKELNHNEIQFDSLNVAEEAQTDVPMQNFNNVNAVNNLKQIIYVYEDHTFEVFNLRK